MKPAARFGGNGPVAACSRRRRIEARLSGDRCSEDRWMKYRGAAVAVTERQSARGWLAPLLDHLVELLRLVVVEDPCPMGRP